MKRVEAVFLDRDGTINYEKNYVHKIEGFELIPGTLEALKLPKDCNIKTYIITNQAGIARGYFTEEQFHKLTRYMLSCFEKNECKILHIGKEKTLCMYFRIAYTLYFF